MNMNKKQSWNIITLFLLMIFGLTAASLLKPDTDFSENENRSLASRPEFSFSTLFSGKYTADYETYLTDQFVFRDQWIGLKTRAERTALRQEVNDVYFGEDGYLIEKHSGSFQTDRAETNVSYLSAFFQQIDDIYGSDHVTAMVVPNALDVLRDKLPAFASPVREVAYLQKIRNALPEGVWFDAGEVLRRHSQEEIYYRTDHHWKTLGAFYVFQEWGRKMGLEGLQPENYQVTQVTDSFRGTIASKVGIPVKEDTIEKYELKEPVRYLLTYNQSDDIRSTVYQENALNTKDQYAYFYGGNYGLIEAVTEANTGRRLLVIKDSYAHCFVPFTYASFDEVDMLDLRYFNQSLSQYMEEGNYTDVLFLYNASGFAEDASLAKLLT